MSSITQRRLNSSTESTVLHTNNNNEGKGKKTDVDSSNLKEKTNPMVFVVFVSLLFDLLAFTIILPLLPSLLEYFKNNDSSGLYLILTERIKWFQELVGAPERYNSVLFGGLLGSMFSFLQFVASPVVGALSDYYGRKPVIVVCAVSSCMNSFKYDHEYLINFIVVHIFIFSFFFINFCFRYLNKTGIAASYLLWVVSRNFAIFVLARFVGGLSKGNISLSMSIITDVSSERTRSRGMALVGVAFSLGFIVGPMIGAMFAIFSNKSTGPWFVLPSLLAFGLAMGDLLVLVFYLKETLPKVSW